MKGYIHSLESFGTVDGPGIRYVVFTQGCPMRCLYCHNPDTWPMQQGDQIDSETIIENYERKKHFYKDGGITVTGGEPLMQIDFVIDLFEKAKKKDIHTCLDTSGITFNTQEDYLEKLDRLLKVTDLVMLDIKHIFDEEHKKLTGHSNQPILSFAKYLSDHGIPMWIRHVIVPGITQDDDELFALGQFIGSLKTVKVLDALPYHTMGVVKYENLGIDYPLKDVQALDAKDALAARNKIVEGLKYYRSTHSKS